MSATYLKSLSLDAIKKFFNSFDTVLADCDGVLWIHRKPLPNSPQVMRKFQEQGKQIFYITNSNCITREDLANNLQKLDFPASEDNVLSTAYLAAYYLKNVLNLEKKVYLIGSTALTQELEAAKIPYCGFGPDIMSKNSSALKDLDPEVGAVVVGHDKHFSYPKIYKASKYLYNKSVHFIATNPDEQYISAGDNSPTPGTGCFVKCIEAASNRKPTIVGKPDPFVAEMINKKYQVNPKRTLMIGDRANTDILFGKNCGFQTLLVLSGISTLDEVNKWKVSNDDQEKNLVPHYYTDTLGDLLEFL